MMNLRAGMSRHIVGVSAILAALVILGYASSAATPRRVASLPEEGFAMAQQAPIEITKAYKSARGSEESPGQQLKEQIKALLPSLGATSAQKEAREWSREEWQIAEKAVADHRGGSKARTNNNTSARAEMVWRPPEEIAGGQANQSR
jgi:hypothetical protein